MQVKQRTLPVRKTGLMRLQASFEGATVKEQVKEGELISTVQLKFKFVNADASIFHSFWIENRPDLSFDKPVWVNQHGFSLATTEAVLADENEINAEVKKMPSSVLSKFAKNGSSGEEGYFNMMKNNRNRLLYEVKIANDKTITLGEKKAYRQAVRGEVRFMEFLMAVSQASAASLETDVLFNREKLFASDFSEIEDFIRAYTDEKVTALVHMGDNFQELYTTPYKQHFFKEDATLSDYPVKALLKDALNSKYPANIILNVAFSATEEAKLADIARVKEYKTGEAPIVENIHSEESSDLPAAPEASEESDDLPF